MVTVKGNIAEFCFFRPKAKSAYILGDFNSWRDGELPMTRTDDGNWVARISLPPGDFKFRYRVDGEWFIDYAAFGLEHGAFGMDSIVRISHQADNPRADRPVKPAPAKSAGRDTSRPRSRRLVAGAAV